MFVALYAVINTPKSSKEEIISVSNHRSLDGMEATREGQQRGGQSIPSSGEMHHKSTCKGRLGRSPAQFMTALLFVGEPLNIFLMIQI